MSSSRYAEVSRLFREAADLSPHERSAFLARACGDDASLRAEVEALLALDDAPHGILDSGDVVAAALGDGRDLHVHGSGDGSLPAQIGRYRIIELIGEGGMGSVFLAEQDLPRRTVALKVIRAAFVLPSARRRFERETAALARLQHPGIAQIYDAGTATTERGTCPFIAMEFVRGQPLMDFVREHSLDVADRVRLVIDICLAVQHAHDQNIVHRDIKPSNVLVTPEGKPKLLDFGIARMADEGGAMATLETRPGQIIGTLPYMSPEQFTTHPVVDARSDIYALGVLLFEVLTGALPRELGDRPIAEAVRAIADEEPRRLGSVDRSLRGDLETIVASCLERDPARRYASAHDLARDLERHLEDQPIVARRASATYQLAKYARRNRVFVSFVVLAMIVLIGGAAASIIWGIEAERARDLADAATVESGRQASIARGRAYAATIAAAAAAIDAADMATAARRLAEIDGGLRETWEFRHLTGRLDDSRRRWDYQPAPVLAAAFTGEGDSVVVSTWDERLIVLGDDLSAERASVQLPARGICLAVVANRGWVIVGCIDGHLRAMRRSDGTIVDLGAALEGPISYVRLSENAEVCVVCDRERSTQVVRVDWSSPERPTMSPLRSLVGRAASVSPDGERVAVNAGDRVDVVSLREGVSDVALGPLGAAWSTAFSPDGSRLLVGHDDGMVRLWRLPDREYLGEHPGGAPELLWMQRYAAAAMRVAFSPDGRSIAVALWNGMLATWELNGRPIAELRGHADVVEDLIWAPDSTSLVSCGLDHTVRSWDARRAQLDRILPRLRRSIVRVRLTSGGERLVVSTRDRYLRLFDAVTCERIAEWSVDPIFSGILELAPDDVHLYAPQMDCSLGRWDLRTRTCDAHVTFDSERIDAIAVDGAGRTVAIGLTDGRVLLLDATTLATIREVGRLPSMVRALVFAPDGARLLGGAATGEVILWTLDGSASPRPVARTNGSVTGLAIAPDGTLAYASSSDQSIRAVWLDDVVPNPAGGPGASREAFTAKNASPVLSIVVSPDGARLFGGLANGRLSVWDARTGDLVLSILSEGRSLESIDLDNAGGRLVTGSTTGLVHIVDQPPRTAHSQ